MPAAASHWSKKVPAYSWTSQVGWTAQQQFDSADLVAQTRQALANVPAVLAKAGGGPQHIVRMTWYLMDKCEEYLARRRSVPCIAS